MRPSFPTSAVQYNSNIYFANAEPPGLAELLDLDPDRLALGELAGLRDATGEDEQSDDLPVQKN